LGRLGIPILSAYVSTKFAIEGLTESISYELEPFGIKVVLIEPGYIKTNIGNSMVTARKSQDANSPYFQLMENMVSYIKHALETGPPPDVVSNAILNAVTNENPTMRYLAGEDVEKSMEASKMMKQNMIKGKLP
jgi:NAD(P)-dependent dehydrogenase (short-subunit alcohol dehydrogenase family)